MPRITVLIPAFNEAPNLVALYGRLSAVAAGLRGNEFEFLFVDDGSTDATPEILAELYARDARVKALQFSRNFGSHAACLAGLMESTGDIIVFLSADLQDPPELLPEMLERIAAGFDVVMAVRRQRHDKWLAVRLANTYHRLMRRYAIPTWPARGADFFMKKSVYGVPVQGWASLMVVLLVVSGFQLLMLGVIGEYLWRIADEVRGAPAFVIQSRLGTGVQDRLACKTEPALSKKERPEE